MVEPPSDVVDKLLGGIKEPPVAASSFKSYQIVIRGVPIAIEIKRIPGRYVPRYNITFPPAPDITPGTMNEIRSRLIRSFKPGMLRFTTLEEYGNVSERFESSCYLIINELMPHIDARSKKILSVSLLTEMIGLGELEVPLNDDDLEEIVVNGSRQRVMVFHKKYGWLETNVIIQTEKEINDMAEKIASRYGKEITVARPILDDAMLVTGDRVTATLYPVSTLGDTITIRKFRRSPWTMTDFISPEVKTLTPEVAALLWLSVQYELNMMIAGGTASGKTSLLNAVLMFIPPEQRIISIEDVRELNLPSYMHWIPLATRESAGEKAEKVDVLKLMLTALRMRPDRIVLGEVRTTEEAQTLFEASDTGHSVYSTLHATRIDGIFRRLLNPPISVPKSMMGSLHLALVQYRQKRLGYRRTLEVAEITTSGDFENIQVKPNPLYVWNARKDSLDKVGESARLDNELMFFSGMSKQEMDQDLAEKKDVLNWMLSGGIRSIDSVSKVIQAYYENKDALLETVRRGKA